jgi:hypothetical protein
MTQIAIGQWPPVRYHDELTMDDDANSALVNNKDKKER